MVAEGNTSVPVDREELRFEAVFVTSATAPMGGSATIDVTVLLVLPTYPADVFVRLPARS